MTNPQVTVGIPTFRRPNSLRRALTSLSSQDYSPLKVIVSSSDPEDIFTPRVVEEFRDKLPELVFVQHARPLTANENFYFVRDLCDTPYFMWLADDDEISSNLISLAVEVHLSQPNVVTAVGNWIHVTAPFAEDRRRTSSFPQKSRLFRTASFMWNSDDAFFYGLHRASDLCDTRFIEFSGRNRGRYTNSAYGLLISLVLKGRVVLIDDPTAMWFNNEYTSKNYGVAPPAGLGTVVDEASRRAQVYRFYLAECRHYFGIASYGVLAALALGSFVRDMSRPVNQKLRQLGVFRLPRR